ncbi:MAG: ABC transporter substrate binding protein, partial [Burkholderiales bacterium]
MKWSRNWCDSISTSSSSVGSEATKALKEATRSIPIVFSGPSYPIEEGLIRSFARPGDNLTGVTVAQSD